MDKQTELPQMLTAEQFCARQQISLSTLHKMKRDGRAPAIKYVGREIRISLAAERAWQEADSGSSDPEARLLQLEADARRRSARKAAKASVSSSKHVSKRKLGDKPKSGR